MNNFDVCMLDHALQLCTGQETSGVALTFALILVHQHPDVLEKLLLEIDEVLGKRDSISFEDLGKLCYTEQVCLSKHCCITIRNSIHCQHRS